MGKDIRFPAAACAPADEEVLAAPGMSGNTPSPVAAALLKDAQALFLNEAEPAAKLADIGVPEFAAVFAGEGNNAADAPLAAIFPQAKRLALFACTVGRRVTDHIRDLFASHDYALGYVLDAVASGGAEHLAALVEAEYRRQLESDNLQSRIQNPESKIVRYSPGYCGWHVSGQRRLFAALAPEEIGITLRESFLMEPLKSVSGVLVLGPRDVHRYEPGFSFCADCRNQTCRDRLAGLSPAAKE
jgi:hypothetical protein